MPVRRRILVAAAVAVLLVAGVLAVRILRGDRTDLRAAVDVVPRSTLRLSFTDWAGVRDALGVHGTGAAAVDRLAKRGYDSDLTGVSSIDESVAALQKYFGFSPLTIDWEAYAQSRAGSAMVVRVPGDLDRVRDHLEDLGFTKPAKNDGVWAGGVDLVAGIDPTITPELQYVAVLEDQHLVVSSDTADFAATAARAAAGKGPTLGDVGSVRDLAGKTGEPAAATLWARDFVCDDLAMSQADPDTQQQAETAIARAGKITPMTGMAMALSAHRAFSVVQLFESAGQAKENLRARAALAAGEAFGRGGSFGDTLRLVSSRTHGDAVVLRWTPTEKTGYPLSGLSTGPVVFASC
ncbi:MAG: hypothetical protein J7518_09890 [Nocardioidaceae bacterium]|nr:hypothetical protein [Nocardioidaceae bacterium]